MAEKTKEKLRETLRRLEAFVEHSPLLISEIDLQGRYLLANRAVGDFFDTTAAELIGKSVEGLLPPEIHEVFLGRIAEVVRTGSPLTVEDTLPGKDGRRQFLTTLFPLEDHQGRIRSVGGIAHDVTAYKKALRLVQEGQERLESIFRVAPIGIGLVRDRIFLEVNSRFCKMVGYRVEELIGRRTDILYPSREAFDRVGEEKYRQIRETGIGEIETRLRRKDGTLVDVLLASTALDGADSAKGAIFTVQDITAFKRTTEALRLNEARLESLLRINQHPAENIQDLLDFALHEAIQLTGSKIGYIYLYDEDKKLFTLNTWSPEAMRQCTVASPPSEYALETTGIWGEAVRQRRFIIVNDFAAPNPLTKGTPRGHVPLSKYLTIPVFCQEKIVAVVGVANKETDYNESDVRQLTLMMDTVWKIVQRKQAEQEREKLQAQLIQAQKMEAVGRLAGGVAHDFNNMLGVILGYGEMALAKVAKDDPLQTDLAEIITAARRSAEMTRQLLGFARRQTVMPKVVDLNDTVEGILKMLRRLIGEDIALVWLPTKSTWPVKIDPSQVDQILANLCVNARDAINGVGKITIQTSKVTLDNYFCHRHPGAVPGQFMMLAVSDDGCGMNVETTSHLFEPFFTTKEVGKGTGLGLATVYGIVKQNNGYIDFQSEPDRGTSFRIYLPRSTGEADASPKDETNLDLPGSETVLLVEDEPSVLQMAAEMLGQLGYRVLPATSSAQALHLAENHRDQIDLLVTDVVMPEMSGKDLAEKLKKFYPHLKTLFMSGYTADVIAHQGVLDEAACFIQKPFSRKALSVKLREAMAG